MTRPWIWLPDSDQWALIAGFEIVQVLPATEASAGPEGRAAWERARGARSRGTQRTGTARFGNLNNMSVLAMETGPDCAA